MPTFENYRHYFDIDPEYISAVNEATINSKPDLWKKFYPHKTFVKLINDTIKVLSRQQKMCVWVEGAYGTGKSHAVLTLKKLLEADESDTKEYFEKYKLDMDSCNKLQNLKNNEKILTVHRYGSSKIYNDDDLVLAIQESLEKTFEKLGIKNKASSSLKNSVIKYLEDSENKQSFNIYAKGSYKDLFGGDDADTIIEKLKTYSGEPLHTLMNKLFKFGKGHPIFSTSTTDLANWLKETITANSLSAIVFIWDEFTEYFKNNRNLTGFQELCEICETNPFYFILVTHVSSGLFSEKDQEFRKLNGRFVSPHCLIELPENIAFQLMAAAMEKNKDEAVLEDWEEITGEQIDNTKESRKLVKSIAKIDDQILKDILPIHPYTALILKQISAAFGSNQRSMFDFIKNDRGDEVKGFQWFIDNFGPIKNANPLLTIDMLWNFFYEKGRDYLTTSIRSILDYYNQTRNRGLSDNEKRILKSVLLMQAISQQVDDNVELYVPNDKNINNAFEGSDLSGTAPARCAEKLVRDKILFKKDLGNGKFQYNAYINEVNDDELIDIKNKIIGEKSTSSLITESLEENSTVADVIKYDGALGLRYVFKYVGLTDFDNQCHQIASNANSIDNRIVALVCFAKNEDESIDIEKKIYKIVSSMPSNCIIIDATKTPLGNDSYEQYKDNLSYSIYYKDKDKEMAKQYSSNAKDYLKKWKLRIFDGEFIVYRAENPNGERITTFESLTNVLKTINKEKYRDCLEENYNVIPNMFARNSLTVGIESGLSQKTKGTFKSSNEATKLEKALEGAWNIPEYWILKPNLLISKIKIKVDSIIKKAFEEKGRISIREIYDVLKKAPYGFLPCNFTAFILGFILKEYNNGAYNWTDELNNDILDTIKFQEMISEIIKLQDNDNLRYKDKYIVAMSEKEKAFAKISSTVFDIPLNLCTSIEQTRERIRKKMIGLSFPIWTLNYILDEITFKSNKSVIEDIIKNFYGLANNNNIDGDKSDNDIALTIGMISLANIEASEDLKQIVNADNCTKGMKKYIEKYKEGVLLQLSQEINDNGQYINVLRSKFNAEAANWVWNIETANQKIDEVILEYRIIAESNKVIGKNNNFDQTIHEWCSKCSLIKISYNSLKDVVNELKPFLEMLYSIKKTGVLLDSKKQKFLDLLKINKDVYLEFQNNQLEYFKRICVFYLNGLSDDDINKIFVDICSNCFTMEKSEYLSMIEGKVNLYKSNLKSEQLKELWHNKTNTNSPKDWSEKNKMPILCLIPENEKGEAQKAFDVLNKKTTDNSAVEKAIKYLEKATFFDVLNNKEELDKAFMDKIVKGSLSVILSDVDKIKDYLDSNISDSAYDWAGYASFQVEKKLQEMAEAVYNRNGYDKAWKKIDSMDDSAVKKYLKDLIKDNMTVGIEIIRDN